MDHQHGYRGHQNPGTCHGDNGSSRGRNAVDLHRDATRVVHQHIVDLGSRYTVAAGAVDPDGDIAGAGHEFVLEQLGCHIIVKPAFLGDGAVQVKNPLRRCCFRRCQIHPLPKLLHWFLPFR